MLDGEETSPQPDDIASAHKRSYGALALLDAAAAFGRISMNQEIKERDETQVYRFVAF